MKIAIIGAGAAGCFAAANIPFKEGREVVIYEKTGKALQKVKVSGGGRCNVTNVLEDVLELSTKYPRGGNFVKKTFHHFGTQQTKGWFEKRGVLLKAEDDGRVFPLSNQSQSVIDCLDREMIKNRVKIHFHKSVEKIERKEQGFVIYFSDQTNTKADNILVTSGGFQREEQYQWLRDLGHQIELPVPSLFTFNLKNNPITSLMGVSVPNASVKIQGTKILEQGAVLITHWGLSGPAVLRASAWGARSLKEIDFCFKININWLGDLRENEMKESIAKQRQEQGKQPIFGRNPFQLPKRLWEFFLEKIGISTTINWGNLSAAHQNKLIELLLRQELEVNGKTTFKEEFVTCGGVKLSEINHNTMESKLVPGLYFAGEVLDVDGITGGFNFQHAWASGWLAANAIQVN